MVDTDGIDRALSRALGRRNNVQFYKDVMAYGGESALARICSEILKNEGARARAAQARLVEQHPELLRHLTARAAENAA